MNNLTPRIAVLILGYNSRNDLKDSISSSFDQTYGNFEVVYIDNNSSDDSLDYIKKYYSGIRIIKNSENFGYAEAYDIALNKIFREGFDGAVLLNPDVVADKNWLLSLVRSAYADKSIAIAQPKIFLWDGKANDLVNTFGNRINYLGFGFCGNYKEKYNGEPDKDKEITYASGCCMLIKKDHYFKIGGFDKKFFMYCEDQDFGWRARIKGYRIILSADSVLFHKYRFNKENVKKFFFLERNRLYFIFKNYSFRIIILIMPALLIMELGVISDSVLKGYFWEKIRGYCGFVRNIKALYRDRVNIQKERAVSDAVLFHFFSPTIDFEEINSRSLRAANLFLKFYYRAMVCLIGKQADGFNREDQGQLKA